ncbi:hypothetical protein [Cryptosporangium arvum]|uniref:hypothetical protein n=1 Tax=Cryptosporangium arvum TaxID=80871 RepID=UPI0004B0AA72|nr:hypothetical protein [Cryptosporangium arvum]
MSDHSTSTPQVLRPLLWVLLTIGMVGNLASSLLGGPVAVHTAFGALTVVSGIALAVNYLRKR